MRVKSEWTPSGVVLWLIAAIAATLVVCSQRSAAPPASSEAPEPEVEFEVIQD